MTIEALFRYLSSAGMEDLDLLYRELDLDLALCGLDTGNSMTEEERSRMLTSYMKKTKVKDSPNVRRYVSGLRDMLSRAVEEDEGKL